MHCTPFDIAALHPPCEKHQDQVRAVSRLLRDAIAAQAPAGASFKDREQLALQLADEAVRRVLQEDLQRLADSFADEVAIDGQRYRRHQVGTVEYHSLCGPLAVTRATYRTTAKRNGPTIVPVELAAGLVDGATPALGYSVAQAYAKAPLRSYEQDMKAAHRHVPSRSTLERLGKRLGNNLKYYVPMIEGILRAEETLPAGAHAITVGIDRTSVAMTEERPPGEPPNSKRRPRRKPRIRRPPEPFDVNYRMVYVGTISAVDRDGELLVARRYAATTEEGPDELMSRLMSDLAGMRAQRPELPLVVVQDGAPELWNLMRDALRQAGARRWHEVYDRYHVNEHLGAVLTLLEKDREARQRRYHRWQKRLDRNDRALYAIATWIRDRMLKMGGFRRDIDIHQSYLYSAASTGKTKYASLRRAGLPIGSGVTEGACKSLVGIRAKRSGQRWQQNGLASVFALRSLLESQRFERGWELFAARHRAQVNAVG